MHPRLVCHLSRHRILVTHLTRAQAFRNSHCPAAHLAQTTPSQAKSARNLTPIKIMPQIFLHCVVWCASQADLSGIHIPWPRLRLIYPAQQALNDLLHHCQSRSRPLSTRRPVKDPARRRAILQPFVTLSSVAGARYWFSNTLHPKMSPEISQQ